MARWDHVNFDSAEWTIPSENSKTGRPHTVNLSSQAIALFRALKGLAGESKLALPGRGSLTRPFAANALNKALEGLNFDMPAFTIHDLRRTGSTLLHENAFPSDVVEKALNHSTGGVRGVYNRAEFAEPRRQMLQFWGDYVESLATENQALLDNFEQKAGNPLRLCAK